ncbi:ribonuclease [Mycolicibacterium phlei]|jgi:membrane protein|uniref:Membrane protein n=1 Tax=Mycolicibacterium phlei DSM 43239 = CCUG 21000 TaxID=1226750 RepID=A0A5N5V4J2_MYCPH|nr:inner membrane protein YhjD [Mycolicibacterium phlei]VEG08440.1 ribonuclease [Mycobacteroides chelonae]AMO60320.1 Inner membrane protein YhjD [Mycolicibacterium phlei]EID17796.1 ribonuclease [Mycolicibacterium phlei RIVM601174]KAB7756638.1 membrane protein [Mycolicibacterium phlei DSM 43239 = CCUG 21000]KXW63525.1 membrane protein [Mycolicibacterium phlei DSM 43239 = CCUG 21000]
MTAPADRPDTGKPGVVDRLRARYPWFDHVMRAQGRYNDSKGDFYAAGITYFTIFALFPLLMVGFSVTGFVLVSQPDLLAEIENRIKAAVSADAGSQLIELMQSAINSRTSVGVIGLLTAAWAGLGWMSNLREALSQMWGLQRRQPPKFLRAKLSDLTAMLGLFIAIVITVALTVVSSSGLARSAVEWLGLQDVWGMSVLLRAVSLVMSVLVSWMLFTWIIARLPRETVTLRSAARAGLLAAVGFEVFKQVASIYLQSVLTGPAGATFGPVLGLMVFAYITARLILFATAWAATTPEIMELAPVLPPNGARITPRVEVREGLGVAGALIAAGVGALGALGISRMWRR